MNSHILSLLSDIKKRFDALPDKKNEDEIVNQICEGVAFNGATLWVLAFAILIASLGLNVNSTAVIIGAMLISPLMGPIIGMGLGIGIFDDDLLKRALKNFLVATVVSISVATLYFLVTPLSDAQSELLARTSPSLYDVLIALCGGAAGIVALSTKGNGNVIPGVAIATALMPPLCTAGYGLATGHFQYFLGAFYLYFINTVFICLATVVGVRLLRFTRRKFLDLQRSRRMYRYIWGVVFVTMLPATYMTVNIVRQSMRQRAMDRFVLEQLPQNGTQLVSTRMDDDRNVIQVVAVGKEIHASRIQAAREHLSHYGLEDYKLELYQGTLDDSMMVQMLQGQQTQQNVYQQQQMEAVKEQLVGQKAYVSTLEAELGKYREMESLTMQLGNELGTLFPRVEDITVAQTLNAVVGTDSTVRGVTAIVSLAPETELSAGEKHKLRQWLQARCRVDTLRLLVEDK